MNLIHAAREIYNDAIAIYLGQKDEYGYRYVAQPLKLVKSEPGDVVSAPCFTLETSEAQRLMDELWNCGLRPSEGTGSAGSLAATERHLRDMQAIAMGLLRKEGMP